MDRIFKLTLMLVVLPVAICCPKCIGETIFSDFFSTDPFTSSSPRWTQQQYHYGFYWTGGNWDPAHDVNLGGPAANLPMADGDTICAFSTGAVTVGSVDRRLVSGNYRISFDFCVKYTGVPEGNFTLTQRVNRQKDERDYAASIQIGHDGRISWTGTYPQTAIVKLLQPGVWYTLVTTVENSAEALRFSSEIFQSADGKSISRSPEYMDSTLTRLQNTYGWGWCLKLSPEGYWSRLVEIDNFTVDVIKEKPLVPVTAKSPVAQTAFDVNVPVVTIPRLALLPSINGTVEDGEWDSSAVLDGFTQVDTGMALAERTRAWLGYNGDRLYVAVRCYMQSGTRPRAEVKTEGGPVFQDDCVELFLDPLRRGTSYHFAGNSISATYAGKAMAGWKAEGWEWKSRQTGFGWEGEMSIPFAAFGVASPKPGEEWGMLLGRTVQVPDMRFSNWAGPVVNTWHEANKYGRLRFGDAPLLVNLGPLDAFGSNIRLGGEIIAPPTKSNLQISTRVIKVHPPAPKGREEGAVMVFNQEVTEKISESDLKVELASGHRYKLASPNFPESPGLYRYEIQVMADDGSIIFTQRVPLLRLEPISVAIRRFPTAGVVEMDADLVRTAKAAQIVRTACELRTKNGEKLWRDEAAGLKTSFRFTGYNKLLPGDYELVITGIDATKTSVTSKIVPFTKSSPPPWFGNNLGKEETVVSPWVPVQVKGQSVEIWGRCYEFSSDGMPAQITAAGKPLLTSPWKVVAETEAGPLSFVPDKDSLKVVRLGDTKAVVSAVSKADGWTLLVKTTVEFDGFAWSEFTITPPSQGQLRRLWLELPITKKYAKYRQPVFNDPVTIPTEGIATVATCSVDWPNQKARGLNWIGDEDRGLCFQAEHDANWHPADRQREITLTSNGDSWVWRCHLQDAEAPFAMPQTYGFAWQATPIKPMTNTYGPRPVGDGWYPSPPMPAIATAEELDSHFAIAKSLGVKEVHTHEPWTEIMGYPFSFRNMDQVKKAAAAARIHGVRIALYSHPIISTLSPEYEEWGSEFSLKDPPIAAFQRQPAQDLHFVCHDTPWSDFYIWGWVRLIKEYGVSGMYFDGTYAAMICTNPNHSHAQKYSDGTAVPVQPIRAARSFMLRLRRATRAADPGFFFLGHGTVPFSGQFLDYFMTGENFWVAPANFEVPLDYLRAVLSPQWGLPRDFYRGPILQQSYIRPLALAHGYGTWSSGVTPDSETAIWRSPVWKAWDNFGTETAEFIPYWQNSPLVTSSNPDVVVSFHRKAGSILVAAATAKRQQPSAVITIDMAKLGLDPNMLKITTGEGNPIPNLPVPDKDGKIRLAFPEAASCGAYIWLRNVAMEITQ